MQKAVEALCGEVALKEAMDLAYMTDYNIIRRMRFACWITKATGTNS
jgi:hypothetical protein